MMFHADKKIGENLGGVILHHETIYQKDDNGKRNCSFFPIGLSYFRILYRINRKMNLLKNCRWFDRARDLERDQNWSGLDVDAWYHGRNDYSRLRRAFELMSESCIVTILYEVSLSGVKKPRKTIFMKDLSNTRRTDVFLQRFGILNNKFLV